MAANATLFGQNALITMKIPLPSTRHLAALEHEAANMAHVKPGARGEIVWQFSQAGEYQFACLIPGHFEAGMIGKVIVK